MKQNYWERLEAVIKWTNMTTCYFARHIGLTRAENLYQIKRGNNGISRALAYRIVDKFPEISTLWLLTGEGNMFVGEDNSIVPIPFTDKPFEYAVRNLMTIAPESYLVLPCMRKCDYAVKKDSTVLFLRQMELNSICPAGMYVIITQNNVYLQNVLPSAMIDMIVVSDADGVSYIDRKDIEAIYYVEAQLVMM